MFYQICVAMSPTFNFEQISFVNGINTSKGGKPRIILFLK